LQALIYDSMIFDR